MNIVGRYTSKLEMEMLFCNNHGITRHGLSNGKVKRWKCLECSSDYSYELKRKNKLKAVKYKGGKCVKCGYDKSIVCLHFHHIDPGTKSFNISSNLARKWEAIRLEADKCELLCMNCHFEEHERIDEEQRTKRKEAMKPDKNYHKKMIHKINCKKLGTPYQP